MRGREEARDDPVPLSSLPPSLSLASFSLEWVLQKVKEIQVCVGVSCESIEEQFRGFSLPLRRVISIFQD